MQSSQLSALDPEVKARYRLAEVLNDCPIFDYTADGVERLFKDSGFSWVGLTQAVQAPCLPPPRCASQRLRLRDDRRADHRRRLRRPDSRTLTRAADLAQSLNAALVVTNVVSADRESKEGVTDYSGARLDQARAFLAERGLEAELVPARVSLRTPSWRSPRRNADLIVVGMRKKGFFERLVEERCARRHAARHVRRPRCPLRAP